VADLLVEGEALLARLPEDASAGVLGDVRQPGSPVCAALRAAAAAARRRDGGLRVYGGAGVRGDVTADAGQVGGATAAPGEPSVDELLMLGEALLAQRPAGAAAQVADGETGGGRAALLAEVVEEGGALLALLPEDTAAGLLGLLRRAESPVATALRDEVAGPPAPGEPSVDDLLVEGEALLSQRPADAVAQARPPGAPVGETLPAAPEPAGEREPDPGRAGPRSGGLVADVMGEGLALLEGLGEAAAAALAGDLGRAESPTAALLRRVALAGPGAGPGGHGDEGGAGPAGSRGEAGGVEAELEAAVAAAAAAAADDLSWWLRPDARERLAEAGAAGDGGDGSGGGGGGGDSG
jgi:hypothetical protein